jgi:hypothetical protein
VSEVVTLRYPHGSEYEMSDKAPQVGDVLKRSGDSWVVVSVEEARDGTSVVTLRPGVKAD